MIPSIIMSAYYSGIIDMLTITSEEDFGDLKGGWSTIALDIYGYNCTNAYDLQASGAAPHFTLVGPAIFHSHEKTFDYVIPYYDASYVEYYTWEFWSADVASSEIANAEHTQVNCAWFGVFKVIGSESSLGLFVSPTIVYQFGAGVFMYSIGPAISSAFGGNITYYNGLLQNTLGVSNEDCPSNFFLAGASQFGNSTWTNLIGAGNSIMYLHFSDGIVVPPEYSAYPQRALFGGTPLNPTEAFSYTSLFGANFGQSLEFIFYFSAASNELFSMFFSDYGITDALIVSDWLTGACEYATYSSVVFTAIFESELGCNGTQWSSSGIDSSCSSYAISSGCRNWLSFYTFSFSYLPFDFFFSGFMIGYKLDSTYTAVLLSDGTGTLNGGALSSLTIMETWYGYNDTFMGIVAGMAWPGLMGPNISNLELWYSSDCCGKELNVYAQSTGTSATSQPKLPYYDVDNIGRHVYYQQTANFFTRDELRDNGAGGWRSCEQGGEYYAEDGKCNVFLSTQAIAGLSSGQIKPFTQDSAIDQVDLFNAGGKMRSINLTYTGESTVHSLDTFEYRIPDAFWLNSVSNPNNAKYRVAINGYLQATSHEGSPTGDGLPAFGLVDSEIASLVVSPEYDAKTMSTFFNYEPILGFPLQLRTGSNVYAKYTSDYLDSGLYDGFFSGSDTLVYPWIWVSVSFGLEASNADLLASFLYGIPELSGTIGLIFVVFAIFFLCVGTLICAKGYKDSAVAPTK